MNLIRYIISSFLAGLLLIASIGITVNLHLCAGHIESVALFVKAQPCKDKQKPCHDIEHYSKMNSCCEEESIILKGKETNAEVKAAIQMNPSLSLIAVILPVPYTIIHIDTSIASPACSHYKPPLIERDITVLVHSFLI